MQEEPLLLDAVHETADWLSCLPTDNECHEIISEAGAAVVKADAIVVAPAAQPRLAAPLGWTLSQPSRASLDDSYSDLVGCARSKGHSGNSQPSNSDLAALLKALGARGRL